MMRFKFTFLIFAVAAVAVFFMRNETFIPRTAIEIYHNYIDATEAQAIAGLTAESAIEIQKRVAFALSEDWGGIAGYKVALTSSELQQKMGTTEPLLGFFLKDMLLESPASIHMSSAVQPFAEADLLVRIKDASINDAKTDQEILAAIDQVIPFIEVPDLLFSTERPLNADMLTAINTGARYGVMGEPIDIKDVRSLQDCQVGIVYDDKSHLNIGFCSTLMGNPIKVVRWVRDELLSRNLALKRGSLVSLGSLTPPVPVKRGTLNAVYSHLSHEPVTVSVQFK